MKHLSPMQINFWIQKINPKTNTYYTSQEALYKIRSFRKLNIEYWIERGFSLHEAQQKIILFQKENSQKFKIKVFLNPEKYKGIHTNQILYWLKRGYSEKEASEKVRQRQTCFSLEKCQKKYGEIVGFQKWKDRQIKWQNTLKRKSFHEREKINQQKSLCLENFIKKYQQNGIMEYFKYRIQRGANAFALKQAIEFCQKHNCFEQLNIKYYQIWKPRNRYIRVSKESLKYFIPIYKTLRRCGFQREDIQWGIKGSQEYKIETPNRKVYYDFVILPLKLIIEYNGIRYHPSPRLTTEQWKKWQEPYHNRTADEKQKRDQEKIDIAKNHNFSIITIWSDVPFEENIKLLNNMFEKWNIEL